MKLAPRLFIISCLSIAACSSDPQSKETDQNSSINIGSSSTVLINGLPAAKQLSSNMDCGNVVEQINSSNVMINGKPAARQTEELLALCHSINDEEVIATVNIGD